MMRTRDAAARDGMPRRPNLAFVTLVLAFLFGLASPLCAQFVKIEAGASDLLPSAGGRISFESSHYTSYFSAGVLDGAFSLGAYVKTKIDSHVVTVGDQPIAFDLPTDIFGTNHDFVTRGIGITAQAGKASIFVFGGASAAARGAQFFQAARADSAAAVLFTDAPLSEKLHLYSKNVMSRQLTSIQAFDWRVRKWLRTGFSGGIGSNQPYFAVTTDVESNWLSVKTAYISASDRFRRLTEPSVFASEVDRENVLVGIKPYPEMLVTLGHQNYLQAQSPDANAPFLRASVNQVQSTLDVARFRFGAGLFQSSSQTRHNLAEAFSVSRAITNRFDLGLNYFRTLSGASSPGGNLSMSIRETLSPRLSLLQVVNYSQGRVNVLYGGSYLSNRFTVSVDYQTLYLPFGTTPFSQGVNIGLRIRLGGVQMNSQTFRSADGRLRYTASAESRMTPKFRPVGAQEDSDFTHLRYIARGHVRDDTGTPIEGAAIRVGDQVLLTNADGEFFVRLRKAGVIPLAVVFGEFLNPAAFRIISAPLTIVASLDGAGSEALVILGRE
jgi:hypothetical protein